MDRTFVKVPFSAVQPDVKTPRHIWAWINVDVMEMEKKHSGIGGNSLHHGLIGMRNTGKWRDREEINRGE